MGDLFSEMRDHAELLEFRLLRFRMRCSPTCQIMQIGRQVRRVRRMAARILRVARPLHEHNEGRGLLPGDS